MLARDKAGPGQYRPGPAFFSDEPPSVASSAGGQPARPSKGRAAMERLGAAGRRAAATASGCRLQLTGLARLREVTLPTQVGEDARLLHLLLEALERPVEAIIVAELNLDQRPSLLCLSGVSVAWEDADRAPA